MECSLAAGDTDAARSVLSMVRDRPRGEIPPALRAQAARFEARVASASGDRSDRPGELLTEATGLLREVGLPFAVAVTQTEHAEWLASRDRLDDARSLADEARSVFDGLRATPWVERVDRLTAAVPQAAEA